jgi:ATP-dependent transcriptional regulator
MNFVTTAFAFLAGICAMMAFGISKIDRKALLNRLVVATFSLTAGYLLLGSLLAVVSDRGLFHVLLLANCSFSSAVSVTCIAVLLAFAGIRGRWFWIVLAPSVGLSLAQLLGAWAGHWFVSGFHPSAWGNVIETTRDPLPTLLFESSIVVNAIIGLSVLVYAWFRSRSKRYRTIALAIFVMCLLFNVLSLLEAEVVWMKLGLPEASGLISSVGVLCYAYLIRRYQHLSERIPDMTGSLLATLKGTALFVNTNAIVAKAPGEANELLGEGLEGRPLAEVLRGCPDLAKRWEVLERDLSPQLDLPLSVGTARYLVHLFPHRNPFEEFDGVLVRIVPEGQLDEVVTAFGLTARERDIAELVCDGLDTQEIAEALFISHATAKTHLHNLYVKTGTAGRADLVRILLAKDPEHVG